MFNKIVDLLKKNNLYIPSLLLYNYKNINISDSELILLIYLLNGTKKFNPKKISEELNTGFDLVMENMDSLIEKGIVEITIRENDGIQYEYVDLSNLYEKLAFQYMNNEEKDEKTTLFDCFEDEFGRALSPIEYELINGWKDTGFSDEIIKSALKEAVFNGVNNFRYIDKILFEWKKKGVKNIDDIEKNRKQFQEKKIETKPLFDYDWLNDTDE